NPPYVAYESFEDVDYGVKAFEPLQAIFHEDPIMVFQDILEYAASHLLSKGRVVLEIDSYLEKDLKILASSMGFSCNIMKDLSQFDRICIMSRSS
ncbi:MAG TPA: protoporphyrinogen oxidase, partial [Clostridiales bacterium]|nr:protoporphyrinogen oxidase [Clostridiales bacterium]